MKEFEVQLKETTKFIGKQDTLCDKKQCKALQGYTRHHSLSVSNNCSML